MAQVDMVKRVGASYVHLETTFGQGDGSKVRFFPKEGSMIKPNVEPVKNEDERSTPFAHIQDRKGRHSCEVPLIFAAKAHAAILDVSGVVSAAMPTSIICKAIMGGQAAAAGGTIASSTTGSATLGAAEGANFPRGTWGAFPYLGQWYPRRVTGLSSETVTFQHLMSGAPTTTTGIAHNSMLFYPTWTNTQSLAVWHAQAHPSVTTYQWGGLGITGNLKIDITPGKEIIFTVDGKGADFQGPADLSLSVGVAADAETAPFFCNGAATVVLQAATATGFTHYPVQKIEVQFDCGNFHKEEYGGTQGITGVGRNPKTPFGTVKVTHFADLQLNTDYDAGTVYSLMFIQPLIGTSGATQRFFILDLPGMQPQLKPDNSGENNGLLTTTTTWDLDQDPTISTPSTDLERAPLRFGWI